MCGYVFLHSSEGEVLRLMLWEKRTGMVNIHMTSCQHLLTMDDAPILKGSSRSSISKFSSISKSADLELRQENMKESDMCRQRRKLNTYFQ